MPRCNGAQGVNYFLLWERYGEEIPNAPDGNGEWRAYELERYRSYLAPRWIKTETITVAEDTTEFTITTNHINHEGFQCIDDVFIRMCTPAATVSGSVQASLYGSYDSDGSISVTASSAILTRKAYTLFRIKNVHGYLEMETGDGGDGFLAATWRGMFPNNYMKVRGAFMKIVFRAAGSGATLPAGTTFEVWATNTMGDLDPRT